MKKSIWWISDFIEKIEIELKNKNICKKNDIIIVETIEEFLKHINPDTFVVISVINIDNNYEAVKKIIVNNPSVIFRFIYRRDNDMLTFKENQLLEYPNTEIPTAIEDLFNILSNDNQEQPDCYQVQRK
jgi:hypothetical protein